jgi:hypothetical protein
MSEISEAASKQVGNSGMHNGDAVNDARHRYGDTIVRTAALILLLCSAAIWESFHLHSFQSSEIWGHLRIGAWILQTKSWPDTGIFSQAANHSWRDFSWGYDALVAIGYRVLGLRVVPAFRMSFLVASAAITFLLAGGRRNFWAAVALSAVAQYMLGGIGTDSTSVSVALFGVELLLILIVQRTKNQKFLFALPLLFFVWANLDIGVVYGIALYVLFLIALALGKSLSVTKARWIEKSSTEISVGAAALIGAACVIATVVNPYGYHVYSALLANQTSTANVYLLDYAAMRFHHPQDYVLLLLAMTAFLWLGMRRIIDLFNVSLLMGCMALAFHSQRDNWLLVLAAVAVIGESMLVGREPLDQSSGYLRRQGITPLVASVLMVVLAVAIWVPRKRDLLLEKVAKHYPVHASEYIRQHGLPGPLFNSYAWGSFLIWYLPEYPVAIDGRRGLYPDEEEVNYFKVMKADKRYQDYPPMNLARTLLLDKTGVMAEALRTLPGFQVTYEDEISVVLLQDRPNHERGL